MGDPSQLTQADTYVASLLDLDTGNTHSNFKSLLGGGRPDIRFGQGSDGRLYITSKTKGTIHLLLDTLPNAPQSTPTAAPTHKDLYQRLDYDCYGGNHATMAQLPTIPIQHAKSPCQHSAATSVTSRASTAVKPDGRAPSLSSSTARRQRYPRIARRHVSILE